jgi:hypothetical protein
VSVVRYQQEVESHTFSRFRQIVDLSDVIGGERSGKLCTMTIVRINLSNLCNKLPLTTELDFAAEYTNLSRKTSIERNTN